MQNNQIAKLIKSIVLVLIVIIVLSLSFGTISAGERGVKTRFGAVKSVLDTGLYMKVPFVDSVHKMNVKTLTVAFDNKSATSDNSEYSSLSAASKDLQDVSIAVVVNYHIDGTKVDKIFQQYNSVENYQLNVIEPMIRETVKSTSAQYTAEELVTKRAEVATLVSKTLTEQFSAKDAIMENFSITNFEFSPDFSKAIEAKVTATQNAEAAKNKLEQIKYEAEQTVVTAKAEAEAQTIKARALESSGGKEVVALEAIKVQAQAIAKWNGAGCTSYCGLETSNGLLINAK